MHLSRQPCDAMRSSRLLQHETRILHREGAAAMPTIKHSLVIHAGRAALFELTQDYDRRLRWDPFLKKARLLNGATREIGRAHV